MRTLLLFAFCFLSFISNAFCIVDTAIGITAPKNVTGNYKALTHYLCDGADGEEAKANAIYNWITNNIKYDVKAEQSGKLKPPKVEKVFKARIGVCEGYAKLFTAMCREAGMKAVSIDGYAKDWMFDNGNKVYMPRHMWCAVEINGKWELADPTWGAGGMVQAPPWWQKTINKVLRRKITYSKRTKFRFKYDSSYFMQNPEVFRLKHLPADPLWQLTDTAMPPQLFEAGDSAVISFNEHYSKLKQDNPELIQISALDDEKVSVFASERAYTYNNRYPLALALRQSLQTTDDIEKLIKDSTGVPPEILLHDAITSLKKSEEHVKEQKKYFPDEYNDLKKNNRNKSTDAKQYMNKIKADDKKLVSLCSQHKKTTDIKYKHVKKDFAAASGRKRELDVNKVIHQEPSKVQKKLNSYDMVTLADSINSRRKTIDVLQAALLVKNNALKAREKQNKERLDSLYSYLVLTDSFMVQETLSRLNMKDNYDDEVIKWSGLFKAHKFGKADTLQKYYVTNYDTMITLYADMQKLQVVQFDVYKKNLHDMEKYCKWNSGDTLMASEYPGWVKEYNNCIDSGNTVLNTAVGYIRMNKTLFAGLVKVYDRQLKLTDYMDKAETMRKKIEEKAILNRQAFDNEENKKQVAKIKSSIKKLESIN